MKKRIVLLVIVLTMCFVGTMAYAEKATKNPGEAEFKEHCALCHPDGGNIINPKKTLLKRDREANSIRNEADIVRIMRKPGPGMTPFDEKTISDNEAKEIAEYIFKAFK
ncbi:MAG: c-type cytochrome [Nitrospirota bacterium]